MKRADTTGGRRRLRRAAWRMIFNSGDVGATVEEIAEKTGFTPQQVGNSLSILRESGLIWPNGSARGSGLAGPCPVWTRKDKIALSNFYVDS